LLDVSQVRYDWNTDLSTTIVLKEDIFTAGVLQGGGSQDMVSVRLHRDTDSEKEETEDTQPQYETIQGGDELARDATDDAPSKSEYPFEAPYGEDAEYYKLLQETVETFDQREREDAAREADPEWRARKAEAEAALKRADAEFDQACKDFPPGEERHAFFLAWERARHKMKEFEHEAVWV
jgi:hypothetical protein